jgi:3-(3-hydroxy-phenyl)propionate hydroxylase
MSGNPDEPRVDVAVVGSGPTGLTLANLLVADGLSVASIDRGRLPIAHPRATHLDDETMRTFQTLRLQDLEKTFSPVGAYRFYDENWQVVMAMAMDRGRTEQGWRSDYMFHQPDFEAVLRGRLNDSALAQTWFGWEITGLVDHGDETRIRLRDIASGAEQEIVAQFAVGCDGANSFVREAMGCDETDYHGTHRSLIVDILPFVQPAQLPERDMFIHAGVRNPLTYVPIASPRLRFELMMRPEDDVAEFERIERVHEVLSPWFRADQYRVLRADVYEWNSVVATPWRSGRLLIAGDAAHQMPPHLGQGMCTGIRDALNLAWKLGRIVRGESEIGLLGTYESERMPHATTFVEVSAHMANDIERMQPEPSSDQGEPEPAETEPLRPPLGPGVRGDGPHAGMLSAQPALRDGRLLDDVVGYRFAVVGDPACLSAVDEEIRQAWAEVDVAVIDGQHDEVIAWVRALGADAVILRPDRYIFGTAEGPSELARLTDALTGHLKRGESAVGVH